MHVHNQFAGWAGRLLQDKTGQFLLIELIKQWGFVAEHPMFQGKRQKLLAKQ